MAALLGTEDAFRYECPYCGEEVIIAAADSFQRCPHFRHKHGNNDTECEKYIGSQNNSSRIRVANILNRFCFYYYEKKFYWGIRFSRDEIQKYQATDSKIDIKTSSNRLIQSQPITALDFVPDEMSLFPLLDYSTRYYISITGENNIKTMPFGLSNSPCFFKMSGEEANEYVRFVRGSILYTNINYLVVSINYDSITKSFQGEPNVQIKHRYIFSAYDKRFYVNEITIKEKTLKIESILERWAYRIEASEKCTLLWPPAFVKDDITWVSGNHAYIASTFMLRGKGNTSVAHSYIDIVDENITKINISDGARIVSKNVEFDLRLAHPVFEQSKNTIQLSYCRIFSVPKDFESYLFTESGIYKLQPETTIFLTKRSHIVTYRDHIPVAIIFYQNSSLNEVEYCKNAEKYYRRFVTLPNSIDIKVCPQHIQETVVQDSEEKKINIALLRYLEEKNNG